MDAFRIHDVGGCTMTRLAKRGGRFAIGAHEQTEEESQCYRRWARASYVIDFAVFAGLLIGVSLYDRRSAQPGHHQVTSGIEQPDGGKLASQVRSMRE
jgi:hypothetical protein